MSWKLPAALAAIVTGLVLLTRKSSADTSGIKIPVLPTDAQPMPSGPNVRGAGGALNVIFSPLPTPYRPSILTKDGRMVQVEFSVIPGNEAGIAQEFPGVPLSAMLKSRVWPLVWLSPDGTYGVVGVVNEAFPWTLGDLLVARRKGA